MNRRDFLVAAATVPLAARFAPGALAGGTPLALVTADTESRVAAIELSTGRVYRSIPTLPGPRSVESVGGRMAVVAHTAFGALSILEGRSLTVRHVVRGLAEPRYTAAHPDGRHVYVTDSKAGQVVALDVVTGRVLGRAAVGGPARHVSLDARGRTLWVSLGSKADAVAIVSVADRAQPRLLRRFAPPFLAHDVGFAPDGRHVWVSSGDRGSLAVYDVGSGKILRRLEADAPPQHVTFSGGNAYVTSGDDGTLRVQSLRDGRVLRTARVPVGSYNVQEAFGWIVTPSLERGTLCVLDRRGSVHRRVPVAASSHDACFVMSA